MKNIIKKNDLNDFVTETIVATSVSSNKSSLKWVMFVCPSKSDISYSVTLNNKEIYTGSDFHVARNTFNSSQ